MPRARWSLVLVLLFAAAMLTVFRASITLAAPLPQIANMAEEAGEEYVVKAGDWLSKISLAFYGDTDGWQAIVDATNEKAATDPRFSMIDDPDTLEVGQLLWIPAPAASDPESGPEDEDDGEVMTDTQPAASATITSAQAVSIAVRFAAPLDGSEVTSPVEVAMIAEGLTVEAAGEIHEGAGHFHILIDADFVPPGELLPFDENHVHFGRGQMTTTLELEPGEHVLRLQFANGAHIALEGERYRDTITVTVAAGTGVGAIGASATPGTAATPSATITTTTGTTPGSSEESSLPSVRFAAPLDGSEVTSPVEVEMEAESLTVEPAGEIHEGAGHFHILIDTDFVPPGELLPFDENHLHLGRGQLATMLELEPGEHVLRLQFANGAHIALEGEQYRDEITITVADE